MHEIEKTIRWAMVLIIISGMAVILLSQPPAIEHTEKGADLIYPYAVSDPRDGRADNATPLNITSIPNKATGDFVIEVGISESIGIDIEDVLLWSSADMISWNELAVEKYRPAVNNTMVVQGSKLDLGTVYLGVSRSDALGPDDYGTVQISAPKDISISDKNEIFEPGLAVYIVIIAAIAIFGGVALFYKAGTDQIKGMMRQIHKEERSKTGDESSDSGRSDHHKAYSGSRHQDPDSKSEISWGGSNDDDTAGWEEEQEENDISWGGAGDERPRNRRRRGRDETRERRREETSDDEIAWGGAGVDRRSGGKGRKGMERGRRQRESDEDEISWGSKKGPRNRGRGRYGSDDGEFEKDDRENRYGARGERSGRMRGERRSEREDKAPRGRGRTSGRKERRSDHIRKGGSERMGERDRRRDGSGRKGRREREPKSTYRKRNDGHGDEYRHASRRYGRKNDDTSWQD